MQLLSKLPDQGVTIFSTMSALAQRLNALNLSQGFPDFAAPPDLIEALCEATRNGHNQYAAGDGYLPLRQQVALQFQQRDQITLDPFTEISITPGATIALFAAIQATIHPGDEVIIFDPSYDSYDPAVRVAGGVPVHIALDAPEFKVDWDKVAAQISSRTRMIIVNTPHNPTGTIWSYQDWQQLIALVEKYDLLVLSDEVYEHLIFEGARHWSALHFPELRERSFVVGSFGKTFHVTGWKTGYCAASPTLMQLFRQIYQYANFCGNTPAQIALTQYMQQHPEHIAELADFYQHKRDTFNLGLQQSLFGFTPCQGTYFQTVDYTEIRPDLNDVEMCYFLAEEKGIVAIPLSVFYQHPPKDLRLIRFCFAKTEQTLQRAVQLLNAC
ncbi:MAG TPA: aminotransferase class V-fold PLP-dependent enzyme [Acinetobacter ursingii]|uniref:methionine aminotransferase n=1 Tax=Acinetobacter ursingii TaxID=108980 RepID=UPI0006698CCB|nr:methionine aminotransferase [Acinetobacter ursingii]MCH2005383.1 methionine aminotransferase [Acinetobacter ursingii]MCH2015132.1 methionine aminotransferase [Acinetobacter ursingii]HCO09135.1 aminotransferase class V-fold PLP-dependent enzyme [Acinetobacter ursingii]